MEAPNDIGQARAQRVLETLKRLVAEHPPLKTQTRALMYAAREQTPGLTPDIKEKEVRDFLSIDPVKQIYQKKEVEWPSKNNMGEAEGDIWNADLLDLTADTIRSDNAGYAYVLLVQSRFSRFLWARPIRRKLAGQVDEPFLDILSEDTPKPKALVTDKGGEFDNPGFRNLLRSRGIAWRLKGGEGDSRAALQNTSIIDSAMGVYTRNLKIRWGESGSAGWYPHVQEAADDYNARAHEGRGMRGSNPNQATGETGNAAMENRITFNLKVASALGYDESRKTQTAAKKRPRGEGSL